MECDIRIATESDVEPLGELFVDAIRTAGPQSYTPPQVESWAASVCDRARFRAFILNPTTFFAVDQTGPIGFCGIEDNGHIASVYLRGDRQRRGIGTRLIQHVLELATERRMARLYAEASEFSLPLFLKMGFQTVGTETVELNGEFFVRHLVELHIACPKG